MQKSLIAKYTNLKTKMKGVQIIKNIFFSFYENILMMGT